MQGFRTVGSGLKFRTLGVFRAQGLKRFGAQGLRGLGICGLGCQLRWLKEGFGLGFGTVRA